MEEKQARLQRLKREKDAVILAHYYVPEDVQEAADYVGDSFYLSQVAQRVEAKTIVLCGVRFMGESAKILNPQKTVLLPDAAADCPMAHMADPARVRQVKAQYPDAAVVCYVNSTAELKMLADVCVTSSNALAVCRALPNRRIFFIPDQHLAHFIAAKLPEKEFLFNDGCCVVHDAIRAGDVQETMRRHPGAKVLVHPECRSEVTALADYVGSTAGILTFAQQDDANAYIVCTERGIFYELRRRCPEKTFFLVEGCSQTCTDMKKVTLDKVIAALEANTPQVTLPEAVLQAAKTPLERMLALSR